MAATLLFFVEINKYSHESPLPNLIYSQLEEIAKRLEVSVKRAEKTGHRFRQFVLITNRPMGEDAEKKLATFREKCAGEKT